MIIEKNLAQRCVSITCIINVARSGVGILYTAFLQGH